MLEHIPSLATLESDDDRLLATELRLARLRIQAAIVGELAARAELLSHVDDLGELDERLIAEMVRLGCRLLEAASALAPAPSPEASGVFRVGRVG